VFRTLIINHDIDIYAYGHTMILRSAAETKESKRFKLFLIVIF